MMVLLTGVGTSTETDKSLFGTQDKERDGALGIGLDENVCEGYNFLVCVMPASLREIY